MLQHNPQIWREAAVTDKELFRIVLAELRCQKKLQSWAGD